VVSQRLLPRADGKGRVVAAEVMVVTPTIRDLIIDDKISEVHDFMREGKEQYGMQTFDQHLADLVHAGEVTYEVALAASSRPSDFDLNMRMLGSGHGAAGGMAPRVTAAVPSVNGSSAKTPEDAGAVTGAGLDFLNP
jgi:twitching motility protein PilT